MPISQRPLSHPRDEIMRTMERIYRYRMTTTSGGNLSIRADNGDIWITPARVDKGRIRREDIVRVSADGRVEGLHPPSSELPFHEAVYRVRPDVKALVHAHPVALVAFSISGNVPDTRVFPQAFQVCGQPGFAPYALPGSGRLGENIAHVFAEGFNCVILENHGVVVAGSSMEDAFQRFETLEFTAKMMIKARQLGGSHVLQEEQIALRNCPMWPTFLPEAATDDERELRRTLAEFLARGYRQRLFISTEGTFSARLGEDTFLITPSQGDRGRLGIEDLVLVHEGAVEPGKTPSRATALHRAIYQRHPEFKAIVNALPVNSTAFSVARRKLDSRTIPESYLFLKDVGMVPFGREFLEVEAIAASVSKENPIALIENDGVLVCGTTVLDAFDRLEVLETTAEALINGSFLGEVRPMSDDVIVELRDAFAM